MFKKILLIGLLVIVVLVGGFAVVVAMQPADYKVERSAKIAAPPATVFEHVNDFRKWDAWSPWAKLDPNCKNTFEGPPAGTGAIFAWDGNDDVGAGKMTILDSKPGELVKIKLEFVRPFEDKADVQFAFKPEGEQTQVTWTMSGHNNFLGKAMCLFMNMDKMIGGDFEKGLASMKTAVEAEKKKEPEPMN